MTFAANILKSPRSQVGSHAGGVGITPTYSSWFNRSNAAELVKKLDPFIRTHNANSYSFVWTPTAALHPPETHAPCQRISGMEHWPMISNQLRYRSYDQITIIAPCPTRGLRPRLSAHDRQFVSVTVKPSQKLH